MQATLFHNPTAGSEIHSKDSMLAAFKLAGIKVRYVSTKDDDVKAALKRETDMIVIAGGDGTVARILTSMPDRTIPVGILPLGSANNIARSLGIAGTPQELVESWRAELTFRLDIGEADAGSENALFVEGFGVGLLPDLFRHAEKKNGKAGVKGAESILEGRAAFRKALKDAEPIDIDVLIDDEPFGGEMLGVEVLNITYTGPGLPLASAADAGDGLLDVICFEKNQRGALLDWIEAPHRGRPPAKVRQGAKVELKWRDVASRIDDKLYNNKKEKKHSLELSCQKQPARILMPVIHPAARAHRAKTPHQ